ncbi:hypothetical protein PUN28_020614 [Cardiocondyla obscurior]|uniref:Uncharacterized protein n=1 Tax=Cardiocondyla obscurior TaxID=286306 RepID=A0AAW2E5F4_9HYME
MPCASTSPSARRSLFSVSESTFRPSVSWVDSARRPFVGVAETFAPVFPSIFPASTAAPAVTGRCSFAAAQFARTHAVSLLDEPAISAVVSSCDLVFSTCANIILTIDAHVASKRPGADRQSARRRDTRNRRGGRVAVLRPLPSRAGASFTERRRAGYNGRNSRTNGKTAPKNFYAIPSIE